MTARAPDNTLTTALPPPTTPATKKSKTTKKKKASKPVDLSVMPMWVSMNDMKKHCIVAITHEQKWVAGDAATITGDIANEPTSNHQWSHKGPFGKRIAPGNPAYNNMLSLQAYLHMMPLGQLTHILELTNVRLAPKEKQKMTHQKLLRWIGVCVLIASINFCGKCRKLWEGGGTTSKYLPSYDLCATRMLRINFDDIMVCHQVVSSTT